MNPTFYRLGMTPNMLTALSILFGVFTFVAFLKEQYVVASVLFWISYLFDCCDGNFARKYRLVTKFGDKLDHMNDLFRNGLVLALIMWKDLNRIHFFFIVCILIMLTAYHMSCQELNYDKPEESATLNFVQLCKDKRHIRWTRYGGCGTLVIFMTIYLAFLTPDKSQTLQASHLSEYCKTFPMP